MAVGLWTRDEVIISLLECGLTIGGFVSDRASPVGAVTLHTLDSVHVAITVSELWFPTL